VIRPALGQTRREIERGRGTVQRAEPPREESPMLDRSAPAIPGVLDE
jgi:hypothetical protein